MNNLTLETVQDSSPMDIETEFNKYSKYIDKTIWTKYRYRVANDYDDMKQIGSEALIKAIKTFDSTRDAELSTYVYRCVENSLKHLDVEIDGKYKNRMVKAYILKNKDVGLEELWKNVPAKCSRQDFNNIYLSLSMASTDEESEKLNGLADTSISVENPIENKQNYEILLEKISKVLSRYSENNVAIYNVWLSRKMNNQTVSIQELADTFGVTKQWVSTLIKSTNKKIQKDITKDIKKIVL